jgi:oxygen-independent coproporphyrinogen-3 oxidase
MKLRFTHDIAQYQNDLGELFRGFYPQITEGDDFFLDMKCEIFPEGISVRFTSDVFPNFEKRFLFPIDKSAGALERKRQEKRHLKIALYRTLSYISDTDLPYGCLTGIRPTKLYLELGKDAGRLFRQDFSVSEKKVRLIEKIVEVQTPLKSKADECDVFVNIPFCPSRCSYCSFVSVSVDKQKDILEDYADCVVAELKSQGEIIKSQNLRVRAVYVGGGTPTALPDALLKKVLSACDFNQREFTVEAGRPDTLNAQTVKTLKSAKVTRISVNPQSFCDKTLEAIGRRHAAADIFKAFKLVKNKFIVNMDLIAMLPDETLEDFKYSLDCAVALSPQNITVHTLCLKRGSELKNNSAQTEDIEKAKSMTDYACGALMAAGYVPYYMYRQKYTAGNLENVGYAKPNTECLYNIDIMEEDTPVFAVGAGAIAKKLTREKNLIERFAHCKEPRDYIKRFEELNRKNFEFWQ